VDGCRFRFNYDVATRRTSAWTYSEFPSGIDWVRDRPLQLGQVFEMLRQAFIAGCERSNVLMPDQAQGATDAAE